MKRSHRIASVSVLSFSAVLFAQGKNFDRYCGKTFAQNDCSFRCASGTDQECIDSLGVEYKCFTMTGCSEVRIKQSSREIYATSRRTAGGGVCASSLKSAITGCDIREPCSIDLDCAATAGELCYSNIGCGTIISGAHEFTMIGVQQTPMDQAAGAGSTLTQTLSTFLEPSLKESKIGLDNVSIIGDPQHLGVMLDVSVKFTGLYRPLVEQNLGEIIIEAFSGGTQTSASSSLVIQNAFISSLNSQGSYYSEVSSILLTLEENGSRVIPSPTLAPTGPLPSPPPSMAPSSTVTVPIINNLPSTGTEEGAGPLADEVLASVVPPPTPAPTAPSPASAPKVVDNLTPAETEVFAGPLADELLASDLDLPIAAKEIAAKEQANAVAEPVVKTEPGGLGLGVIIGIVAVVLIVSIVVLGALYLQYEKKRIIIVEKRLTMLDGDDAESDLDSINDLESGEGSSMSSSSSDSLEVPRSPRGSRRASMDNSFPNNISMESEQKEMAGSNLMQSRHMKGEEDDERTFNSSDSNSNSSRSSDSQHSGAASGSEDSGTSSDDSSSDESDDSSRKAAAAAAMRKSFKRRISTDEEMKEEMLATWNNPSLKQHERVKKMSELKSRRQNIKKLSKEAESESFQRSLNRIRGGKPRSTRSNVVSSGSGASSVRKSMTRRNSMTRTMSSGSLGQSDGNLNLSSHSNTQKRRSSMVAERRNSITSRNDLANSDQHLERKKLSSSVNSFNSSSDLATSDYHLERKKLSSMKAWQRPQSRRLSM